MFDKTSDIVQHWERIITDRRTLAKAGALFTALQVFDFTIGNAQTTPGLESNTRATDWYESNDPDAVFAADIDGFVTVYADFPFTAIGASWNGEVGRWPLIEIQTSYDGGIFGDPTTLPADADSGYAERDDRVFTRLLFANGETVIRYRTTDRNGLPTTIAGFGLTWIDASSGPSLDDLQTVEPADITTPPAIISRASWGADDGLRFSDGVETYPRAYELVSHAVVHHSETSNTTDPLQEIRSIYYFHAITRDWGDIGYNYLVDRYGNVYEGRVGGQNVIGTHTLGHNTGTAGICLLGNHLQIAPSTAAVSGLIGALAWICRDLDPLGFSDLLDLTGVPTISGHLDIAGSDSCPGVFAYSLLPSIRTSVAATIAESPISPAGGFVVGDLISVATGDGVPVNFRASPGLAGQLLGELSDGVLGQITGDPVQTDTYNWYPVSTYIGSGWIQAAYLENQLPPLIENARFTFGDSLAANRTTVVLLEQARPTAPVAFSISKSTTVQVQTGPYFLGGKIWYRVTRLSDGSTGWGEQGDFAFASQPTTSDSPAIGNTVNTTALANFRTEPTTAARLLGQLPFGTEATVTDGPRTANGYTWFRLQTAWGIGWMASDFLRVSGTTTIPPTTTPAKFQIGDTVTNPNSLNLRQQPSTSGSVIALMTSGTIGTVIEGPIDANGYSWYRIETSYGTGWSAGELLDKSSTPPPNPDEGFPVGTSVRTTSSLNMRANPSLSGNIVQVIPTNTIGTVLDRPVRADGYTWYRIQASGNSGWVADAWLEAITISTGMQISSTVRTTTNVNMRSNASLSGSVLAVLPTNTTGTILAGPTDANGYSWYRLQTTSGTGWVAGTYLASTTQTGIQIGSTVRTTTSLRLRSAASTGAGIITVMATGTTATVIGGPTRANGYSWWQIQSALGVGWAAADYLAMS